MAMSFLVFAVVGLLALGLPVAIIVVILANRNRDRGPD
jgi:hypothetical protein